MSMPLPQAPAPVINDIEPLAARSARPLPIAQPVIQQETIEEAPKVSSVAPKNRLDLRQGDDDDEISIKLR
jgi:hypothetical protein